LPELVETAKSGCRNLETPHYEGKERASDKPTIPIPTSLMTTICLSDQDLNLLEEYGEAAGFLAIWITKVLLGA
jgi:hypothetical protein